MKIRIYSDLHFKFMADRGKSFVESIDPSGFDVLVVAGDLCTAKGLYDALGLLCGSFKEVVFCCGNHEYYDSNRERVNITLRKAADRNPNLHVLEKDIVEIGGYRFLGTTLWFPNTRAARLLALNWGDFSAIEGLQNWVYKENEASVRFLRRGLTSKDIVITHHLPSFESVHPKYAMESTNCFFVCDLEDFIKERQPVLWVHGHTHESADYQIGKTRVVCNPFGYVRYELNSAFKEDLTIELP